jgi:hypothetical protein
VLGQSEAFYKRHPDDRWIDEVRMVTVPRFKTSGLSGDEWRTSVRIEFWRKGEVIHTRTVGDLQAALMMVAAEYVRFGDDGIDNPESTNHLCFQPGCSDKAVSEYELKANYCREGHKSEPHWSERRRFCQKHLRRGDCALEDADANYTVIAGPGPDQARGWEQDESPATQVMVQAESLDEIGQVVADEVARLKFEKDAGR